jgi:hypothetical protein
MKLTEVLITEAAVLPLCCKAFTKHASIRALTLSIPASDNPLDAHATCTHRVWIMYMLAVSMVLTCVYKVQYDVI